MDINYLLSPEQQSLIRAGAPSRSARAVHRGYAKAYGRLLKATGFRMTYLVWA